MKYEIVLKNGNEVTGYAKDTDNVVEMMLSHDIFVIQENDQPDKVTYILPKEVSHFRFEQSEITTKPVI